MSPIPWAAILTHGPTVLAAARSLLATQTRQARDKQPQSIEAQLDQLEKASVESARLLQEMAEQIQALTAAQQELQRRVKLALIVGGVASALAVGAAILAIVN